MDAAILRAQFTADTTSMDAGFRRMEAGFQAVQRQARQAVDAVSRSSTQLASAATRDAARQQRVWEQSFQSISRAEARRATEAARAAQAVQRENERAARQAQQLYERAFSAITRAEQRRAAESARLAQQAQRAQEQAARAAQRAAEQSAAAAARADAQAANARAREAQRAAAAQAQAERQRQRLAEQINRQLSQAEARRASDAARSAQAEARAREAASRQWIRAQVQAIREAQRAEQQRQREVERGEQRMRREQERLARQWARANQQAQQDAARQQPASGGGVSAGGAAFIGGAAGAAAALAVNAITAAFDALTTAARAAAGAYQDFMAEGIRFNAQLESTKLAIQSLVAGNLITSGSVKDVGQAFRVAGPQAEEQLRKLRIEALASTATFEGLATAFQQAIGPGLAKGLSLDQIRTLTLQIGQAGKALGQNDFELPQEVRAILEGKIDRNARVANALQITSADIAKFKGNADGLFNYLNQKTQAYRLAGELAANTFAGLLGNVKEVFTFFAAESSIKTFDSLKAILGDIQKQFLVIKRDAKGAITDVQIAPAYKELASVLDRIGTLLANIAGGALKRVMDGAQAVGRFLGENREQVNAIFKILDGIGSDLLANASAALRVIVGDGNQWLDATQTSLKLWRELLDVVGKMMVGALSYLVQAIQVFNRIVQGAVVSFEQTVSVVNQIAQGINLTIAGMDTLIAKTVAWANRLLDPLGILTRIGGFAGMQSLGAGASGDTSAVDLLKLQQGIALVDTQFQALGMFGRNKGAGGGGGAGKGGGGGAADALREAKALAKAQADALIEAAERSSQEIKARNEALRLNLEQSYADQEVTVESYYARVRELDEANFLADLETLNKRLAAEQAVVSELRANKAKRSEITRAETEVEKAKAQIKAAGAAAALASLRSQNEEAAAVRERAKAFRELQAEIFGFSNPAQAEIDAINQRFDEMLRKVQQLSPGLSTLQRAFLNVAINQQRETAKGNANFGNLQNSVGGLNTQFDAQRLAIENQVLAGTLQRRDAEVEIARLNRLQAQALVESIPAIQAVANALPESERAKILLYIEQLRNQAITLTQTTNKVVKDLAEGTERIVGDALANFRGNFDELWRGILSGFLQMLQQIIARAAAANIARLLFGGGGGGGGGFLGWLGLGLNALLGFGAGGGFGSGGSLGSAGAGVVGSGGFSGTVIVGHGGFRAMGGAVKAGVPYMVGERGMEMFVPNTDGVIKTNRETRTMGTGVNVTNNFHISSPDGRVSQRSQQQIENEAMRGVLRAQRLAQGVA